MVEVLIDCYGYTAEFFKLNAYDAVRLFKNDFNLNKNFLYIKWWIISSFKKIQDRLYNVFLYKEANSCRKKIL